MILLPRLREFAARSTRLRAFAEQEDVEVEEISQNRLPTWLPFSEAYSSMPTTPTI